MYKYEEEKPKIFTEEGQETFLKIRDTVNTLLEVTGATTMGKILTNTPATGDVWFMMACVDRLVEMGEIREVTAGQNVWGQDRIFTFAR